MLSRPGQQLGSEFHIFFLHCLLILVSPPVRFQLNCI